MASFMAGLALLLTLGAAPKVEKPEKVDKAPYDPRDDGPNQIDVSAYPPEQQERYPIFYVKCAKCHPVARPINSRFDANDWKRYMKKMIRRPNSGINEEQAVEIYEFLKFYASRQAGGK
jgi:hypothetical protein